MAIDIDVRNDKFPYLARQIQGNIAKAFGLGIDVIDDKGECAGEVFINL